MALKRVILEMGHGNDMHGGDYTKAALRAVQDCIHHSSLPFLRSLDVDPKTMQIEVTIGVEVGGSGAARPILAPMSNWWRWLSCLA